MTAGTAAPDLAIRLRRAAFNRALSEGDLDTIASVLARDTVMVTGTDSAVIAGRRAQLMAWKREFSSADGTIYSRLPETIETSSVEPIALERGIWSGVSKSGLARASGTYAAKWRLIGADWVIEAEIYLTLA